MSKRIGLAGPAIQRGAFIFLETPRVARTPPCCLAATSPLPEGGKCCCFTVNF